MAALVLLSDDFLLKLVVWAALACTLDEGFFLVLAGAEVLVLDDVIDVEGFL